MKPFAAILILTLLLSENLSGQNSLGLPEIKNFNKQHYLAGTQNWDIEQDANGVIYFANNEGLLSFDGSYWKLYPTPNKTIVRSIQIDGDRIYVGAQNEIGYFSPNKQGTLVYTSLLPLLPKKEQAFSDVWNIVVHEGAIFFQANNKIIRVQDNKTSFYYNYEWKFLGSAGNRLFAQDGDYHLLEWRRNQWTTVPLPQASKEFLVTGILPYGTDTLMLTSFKQGAYLFAGNTLTRLHTPALDQIAAKNIYKSIPVQQNQILMATSLGGCFIVDKKGNLVQRFSLAEGLQNNNIRHAFLDKNRNLWLGLDNGIDFLTYDNAIKHIYTDRQNEGGGYAALIHDDKLYLGTSNGLYYTPTNAAKNLSQLNGPVLPVSQTEGQVWNLSQVNGQLLMGHHEGAFTVNNNTAVPFDRSSGFWNFFPLPNQPAPLMVAGTYYGISFYNTVNGSKTSLARNINFESARIVATDNEDIWVAHPYKGIFKVAYKNGQPAYTAYAGKGINSRSHYYVYRIRKKIVVPTEKGFFEYNAATDRFEPSPELHQLFGEVRVNYMKEDSAGNIWFTSEKSLGVVDFSGPKPTIIYIPELNGQMVSGFDFIYPVNKNNVLVGGEQGFYHINYEQYRANNNKLAVLIRTVRTLEGNHAPVFGGYYGSDEQAHYTTSTVPELEFKSNSLRFEYSSPFFGQQSNIEYNYRLEGFDKAWSGWAKKTEKEYTNLPPGTYSFAVKARNNLGNESPETKYTFTILAPWYRSPLAYFLYSLLLAGVVYLLYRKQKQKFAQQRLKYEEEQKRLQYLHQLEIERNEQAIVRLKNEKLESEINHKNKELAATAMHLVHKGELMGKIREELLRSLKNMGDDDATRDFRKIIKMMTEDEKLEQDWENFAFHFDRVHGDFLMLLKEKFPQLTNSELKLCAYLRMNLSTKEIAQLMNITVRGVEVSRYRLRKKLQIPTEVNLFDYLTEAVKDYKPIGS